VPYLHADVARQAYDVGPRGMVQVTAIEAVHGHIVMLPL
jgi:hypothetical protein